MRAIEQGKPRCIEPGHWPERSGRARVLVEDPDATELWAAAVVLRRAGYDVATCVGPTEDERPWHRRLLGRDRTAGRTVCPLLVSGQCTLVDGADAVVSPTYLADGPAIQAAVARQGRRLIVEGTTQELAGLPDDLSPAAPLRLPVTPTRLLEAVESALAAD